MNNNILKKAGGLILALLIIAVALIVIGDNKSTNNTEDNKQMTEPKEAENKRIENEPDAVQPPDEQEIYIVEKILSEMTLEEKVLQMFIVTPEDLMGYTASDSISKESIEKYPVGGIILFAHNIVDEPQLRDMLAKTKQYYKELGYVKPFLSTDEEGGDVVRVANNPAFDLPTFPDMSEIGKTKDLKRAYEVGKQIGKYLADLGFNLDYAPVADVLSEPSNTVIGKRSFGSDPDLVADMNMEVVRGLEENGVYASLKHFPGHGATVEDTHEGLAYTNKTLEELYETELKPFAKGIEEGVPFIMISHISVPNVTGSNEPSSVSKKIVNDLLREEMKFEGIIITDAMNMGAISEYYDSNQIGVMAILAGVDIVLMPYNFESAYEGVLEAVKEGEITEQRIDESVRRILKVKYE